MPSIQERKTFGRFDAGLITINDMNTVEAPSNALADCQNVEINDPVLALKVSDGVTAYGSMPAYAGNRYVAHKCFNVDSPSQKSLICLITASGNILKYSEDFEISSVWTFTADGATLTPNSQSGPIRKADRLTNIGASTVLEQIYTGVSDPQQYLAYSIYFKKSTAHRIRIANGSAVATSVNASGTWQRLTLITAFGDGSSKFTIDFPDSAGADTCDIWGAQVELVDSGTSPVGGYGYTFDYVKPYYIWLSDAYINGAWTGVWTEMTERRAGIASSTSGTAFTISGMDGADNYYNNWFVCDPGVLPLNYIIDYSAGVFTVPDASTIDDGDELVIGRFGAMYESPQYNASNINDEFITILPLYNELKISLSNGTRPITIAYVNQSFFPISDAPFVINSHIIDLSCHITWWTSGMAIGGDEDFGDATHFESCGLAYQGLVAISAAPTSGGSLEQRTYDVFVTAMIGNQRIVVQSCQVIVTGTGNNSFDVTIPLSILSIPQRLSSLDIYVGVDAGNDTTAYFWQKQVLVSDVYWTVGTQVYTINVAIASYDTAQNSLLLDLGGRPAYIDTRARYNLVLYMGGRLWISNMSVESSMLRYSNIRNITEELDNFAYNSAYGYALIESNSGEGITGLSQSLDGDLLIVKRRTFFVYQIQTGNIASRRLRQLFQGIGCSDGQGIVASDIGNFFYDANDVYWYKGGYSRPDRISQNRIRQYWRSGAFTPEYSFMNRAINEYWIFGRLDDNSQIILRYSPEYNNWNIMSPSAAVPFIWASDLVDGEVIGLNSTGLVTFNGDSGEGLETPYALTHKVRLPVSVDGRMTEDSNIPKIIEEVYAEYDSDVDITIEVIVDNESSSRNTIVFPYTANRQRRPLRAGISANFIQLKVSGKSNMDDDDMIVKEFGVTYRGKIQRYGARR